MILLLLLIVPAVAASGMGASPHELSIDVEEGEAAHATLTVYNLEDEPLTLHVKSSTAAVEAQSTTVHTSKPLLITVDAQDLQPGTYQEHLTLQSRNQDVALGLNIPLTITVEESSTRNLWLPFIIGLSAYLLLMEGARRIFLRHVVNTFK